MIKYKFQFYTEQLQIVIVSQWCSIHHCSLQLFRDSELNITSTWFYRFSCISRNIIVLKNGYLPFISTNYLSQAWMWLLFCNKFWYILELIDSSPTPDKENSPTPAHTLFPILHYGRQTFWFQSFCTVWQQMALFSHLDHGLDKVHVN